MGMLDLNAILGGTALQEEEGAEGKKEQLYLPTQEELEAKQEKQRQFLQGQSGVSKRARTLFLASVNSLALAQTEYIRIGMLLDNMNCPKIHYVR